MKEDLQFIPILPEHYQKYIEIGTQAYNEHYPHLWKNGDTSTYIKNSFTKEVLRKEQKDLNTRLFLVSYTNVPMGILKYTIKKSISEHTAEDALYVDKIYFLKSYTGRGIGQRTLNFITLEAKAKNKKIIWLDAMVKGPALLFYIKNGFKIVGDKKVPFDNAIEDEKAMYTLLKKIT